MKTQKKICVLHQTDEPQFIWKNVSGIGKVCRACYQSKCAKKPTAKRIPIPARSPKRKKEEVIYTKLRRDFLDKYPICGMNILNRCTVNATEIQHLKGRGEYYLDTSTWMSACHSCHAYATDHPKEAIENGWAKKRLGN